LKKKQRPKRFQSEISLEKKQEKPNDRKKTKNKRKKKKRERLKRRMATHYPEKLIQGGKKR